jgi:hypothetical protein
MLKVKNPMNHRHQNGFILIFCSLLALFGLCVRLYSAAQTVTNYPLPMDWSESGRIFEAASIYSPWVLGKALPSPWLDPARAILEGIILLVPSGSIGLYRFWLVCLSFVTTVLTTVFALKKARETGPGKRWPSKINMIIIVLWGILFLLQGPIYPHLLVGILILFAFLNMKRPWTILAGVVLASIWEGLGRVNWFIMPAMVTVVFYLLAVPVKNKKLLSYFLWPAIWLAAGVIFSILSYWIFMTIHHYPIPFLDPDMNYAFFRFKLLPNSGFLWGLLPGILLVSLPLFLLIFIQERRFVRDIHISRLLSLGAILAVFFIGSTIIGLRAGGGFDLHNYDSYILLLFIVAIFVGLGNVSLEENSSQPFEQPFESRRVMSALLIMPVILSLLAITPQSIRDRSAAEATIQKVQQDVTQADKNQGPILFIDDRHLLVYHQITTEDIFLPYEKIDLMEMAMANNRPFIDGFWNSLEEKRFSLIISEPLQLAKFDLQKPYGYENNMWIETVSIPVLRNYDLAYQGSGLAIYVPKKSVP